MSISNSIKTLQDKMRMDDGINGDAQRLEQMVWLLFLKLFDVKEKESESIAIIKGEEYTSIIPKELRWSTWAEDSGGLTGENLLKFIDTQLFPGLKRLEGNTVKHQIVRDVFADTHNYMKSGTLLRQVINIFNEVRFERNSEKHEFNDIYEKMLKELQAAGTSGEFYTPRAVTNFVVEMIDPKIDETVHDFACGTGGFLTSVIEHINNSGQKDSVEAIKQMENNISGIEKKQLPHALAMTNLILHGFDTPKITRGNSLEVKPSEFTSRDQVDVIVTNPPYGGSEEKGIQSNFPVDFRCSETADLFMYLLMERLSSNGRAGIVLPDSILFGDGVKTRLKEKLLKEFNLHTIVRLPMTVFAPYTSIATNLLFFEKGTATKEVWYYQMRLPKGYKSYSKTKPILSSHFNEIREWWNDRVENDNAYLVDAEEIIEANYNLDIKHELDKQKVQKLPSTKEVINEIKLEMIKLQDIINTLNEVEEMIGE